MPTPKRYLRASDAEYEAWVAASSGNFSAWARSALNAAANGGATKPDEPVFVPAAPAPLEVALGAPRGYRSEPFSLVCPERDRHVRGTYCAACHGDGGQRR
jgi:hypothetical protein